MEARKEIKIKEVKPFITYKKLNEEIFSTKIRINNLERDLDRLKYNAGPKDVKAQNYDLKSGSPYILNVNDLYGEIEKVSREINKWKKKLLELEFAKDDLEDWLKYESTKLEKKVFYYREVEEMSLKDISEELSVSYDYVRVVSSKVNKKMEKFLKSITKSHNLKI